MLASGDFSRRPGVGLKPQHVEEILADGKGVGWFEVHAENYMGAGGPPHAWLEKVRSCYPLSVHGVGLSIGGSGEIDRAHLARLKTVVDRYEPGLVSEHLAWSTHQGRYFNDLLAVPYTRETLQLVCEHVDEVQTALGRRILLENPATYVWHEESVFDEPAFIAEVLQRAGCGLLLDVNNVHVACTNHGWDSAEYIRQLPTAVGEVHLAGHAEDVGDDDRVVLIDAHDRRVSAEVWALFELAIEHTGRVPVLIEWDNDIPEWPVLAGEADLAAAVMDRSNTDRGARHVA
ncbi:MAG: DUF692 domain-containing protein [Rhodospirillales bacterium]